MKAKSNQNVKREGGITLIALIITIILLVILAAITIKSIYEMNIVKIASDAVIDYATEQNKELNDLDDITKILGQITGDDLMLLKPTVTITGTKANGNVYSSDVVVGIKDSMEIATLAKIEIHYKIEGLNEGREETVQGKETSLIVVEEGRYKIQTWMQDSKGNKSEIAEEEFIIDKSKPSEPRISLTGTQGDNEYYIDNKVGVKIEAGENITSGVSAIKYRVEGANGLAEQTVYADTAEFEIEVDGDSTIIAKIISNAGVVSDEITRTMKKDSTKPNVATLTYNTCDTTTITVTANGQDATSKVASYIFEKSTDNTNFSVVEEVLSGNGSISYTYKKLADGTKYYLRVTVKDNAGLVQPSNVVIQETVLANQAPTFVGTPTVAKVANSNTSLTITAKANDADGDNLTYTLCDASGNAITTNVSQTINASGEVVFTHSGLGNASTHTYIVKVSDGKVTQIPSEQCSGTTYCKGTLCTDWYETIIPNSKVCNVCNGQKTTCNASTNGLSLNETGRTGVFTCTNTKCIRYNTQLTFYEMEAFCSTCGARITGYSCSACNTLRNWTNRCTETIPVSCSTCGNDGLVDGTKANGCPAHRNQ